MYDPAYDPPPTPEARRKAMGKGLIILGALALVAWAIVPHIPLGSGGQTATLQQGHALCSSGIGQLGQMCSQTARNDCGAVGMVYDGLAVAFWGGLTAIVAGVWVRTGRRTIP